MPTRTPEDFLREEIEKGEPDDASEPDPASNTSS